jgi:hypothetical protein
MWNFSGFSAHQIVLHSMTAAAASDIIVCFASARHLCMGVAIVDVAVVMTKSFLNSCDEFSVS